MKWYAMRVAYGREMRVRDELALLDVETYLPVEGRLVNSPKGKVYRVTPIIPHVIFVHTTEHRLFMFKREPSQALQSMRYMMTNDKKKIIVPDKQLDDFRRVVESGEAYIMQGDDRIENIKVGRRIIITEGKFAGVEGEIMRIEGNRSVVISLAGLSYAVIRFVPRAFWKDKGD